MSKFYIQDRRSFVGNSVVWWRAEGKGYTTKLDEAGQFDEAEAMSIHKNRATDVPWPVDMVDPVASRCVDAQRLPQLPVYGAT